MQRTDEEWAGVARYVRHAVNKVSSTDLPLCLPGEPQECGQSARQHAFLWAAELKAVAHHLIEESADSQEEASLYAAQVYRDKLTGLRETASQSA